MSNFIHLSDQEILMALDGELPGKDLATVNQHLEACWPCRVRKHEMESAITEFVQCHRGTFEVHIESGDGPRSLLRARLGELAAMDQRPWRNWLTTLRTSSRFAASSLLALIAILVFLPSWNHPDVVRAVSMPDPHLTPGATIVMQPGEVCATDNVKNRIVPPSLQRKVFEKYGIRDAPPQAYEVDYLITPALGGAEDEHNLWPHSYESTVWNAFVKDQLEDYMREQVCSGAVDLATAQREIAGDWIGAYKKYFNTDRPLKETPR